MFLPCLLAANFVLLDPELPPPSLASRASRDELLVGLPAVDRRGVGLVHFLHTKSLTPDERRRVEEHIVSLGSDDFRRRDRAMRELFTANVGAMVLLRKAAGDDDLERKLRAELCLAHLERRCEPARTEAALRLLAVRRPAGARAAILGFLPYATEDDLFDEALSALVDLGPPDGPACENALASPSPSVRGGAALVLGLHGLPEQQLRARKVLDDPDPTARLLAAYGLASGHAKSQAVACLVDLLEQPGYVGRGAQRILLAEKHSAARLHLAEELSPSGRARTLARHFLDALAVRQVGELPKIAAAPFFISGVTTLGAPEDLERVFLDAGVSKSGQPRKVQVEMPHVFRGEEYFSQAPEEERAFMRELGPSQVRAVLIETVHEGQRDRGVLLLRVRDGEMRVIGFGRVN